MRRHSPLGFMRHRSPPPRRRGRGRSLSPLSRSQPAPPGEERGRKPVQWDGPRDVETSRNKRYRSRSRSREWLDRPRDSLDREAPFKVGNGRPRGRELSRDKITKDRESEKSRDRIRERDRPFHLQKDAELKDGKSKRRRGRSSSERILNQSEEFEESYLDQQPNHFRNDVHKNHDNIILDPSSITFNTFVPESRLERDSPQNKPRDLSRDIHHQSPRDHHLPPRDRQPPRDVRRPPPREVHNSSASGSLGPSSKREVPHHGKEESASERINRLEKLVEKLVETNVNPGKSKDFGQQPSKGIIPELIPSNNKFTTSMWLNCIHEECLNRNYDEKSSIRFMQDQMTGIMKAWFKTVANYDFTWPELKLLITKTFPDNTEFSQTLKLLVLRDKTADETITQYFFSKVYLCEACKVSGENAVSCLIDGLSNPFMKQDIKSYNILTPEALYSDYLSKFPENEVPIHMDRREVIREVVPEYIQDEFIPLEMDNRERDHQVGKIFSYPRGEHFQNRLPDRKKCFTCKKFGHLGIDCRHAPICYTCKKKGHIAAKCPFSNMALITSVTSSGTIPKMKCSINGQEYYGVIDTGSVAVTVKEQLVKDLKLKMIPTMEVLKGYGGSLVVPVGETEVYLSVNSIQRLVKALVIEDKVQHDQLIVGQAFLSQDGVALYHMNGQVAIFDNKINKQY